MAVGFYGKLHQIAQQELAFVLDALSSYPHNPIANPTPPPLQTLRKPKLEILPSLIQESIEQEVRALVKFTGMVLETVLETQNKHERKPSDRLTKQVASVVQREFALRWWLFLGARYDRVTATTLIFRSRSPLKVRRPRGRLRVVDDSLCCKIISHSIRMLLISLSLYIYILYNRKLASKAREELKTNAVENQ